MGNGASKEANDGPRTVIVPIASAPPKQPPYNPQCVPQPGNPGTPIHPTVSSGLDNPSFSVPVLVPETTISPHHESTRHVAPSAVETSKGSQKEFLLEIPSIEVLRTDDVNTDTLKKYFSNNKKSHGGKIESVHEDEDCYVINFDDIEVAQDVLSHTHEFEGTTLQVRHRKSPTVEVITRGAIDEEHLRFYFKNKQASGGGPIDGEIKKGPEGVYYITFKSKGAVVGVLEKSSHSIEGKEIIVSEKLSEIDRKNLLLKDLPVTCTGELLENYLGSLDSAQDKLYVAGVIQGDDKSMAVVSLQHGIDGRTRNLIAKEVKRVDLKGQHVSVHPMLVTRSVQLSGLNKDMKRDLLVNYFENTERSNGGKVLDITMDEKNRTAIIRFKDHTVVQSVVSRPIHEFESGRISVRAYYESLGTIIESEFKRKELSIANVESSKLRLMEKQLPSLQAANPNVEFRVNPFKSEVTIVGVEHEVQKAQNSIKNRLEEFVDCRWSISDELQSILSRENTKKTLEAEMVEENVCVAIEKKQIVIWGLNKSTVKTAERRIRDALKESRRRVPTHFIALKAWHDLLNHKRNDATMSCNKSTGEIKIAGLVRDVDDIESELDVFLKQHSLKTSFVEVERPVVEVLVKRQKDQLEKIEIGNEFEIKEEIFDRKTGFKITGPRDKINEVSTAVNDLASKVLKIKKQYREPGLGKLFGDDTFQTRLKSVEENRGCALRWYHNTQGTLSVEKTSSESLTPSDGSHRCGPISVDIQLGRVESQPVDVIINPVTYTGDFTEVGEALYEAGGDGFKKDFKRCWDSRTNAFLAGAGKLRCEKVAHMVLPPDNNLTIKDAVCQCLVLSNQQGMTSIACPAIGTGKYEMGPSESAKAIRDGIQQFIQQNPAPILTHVKLTIFKQEMLAAYKAEFDIPTDHGGPPATGIGSVAVQIHHGDLTKETTDAVVNPVSSKGEFYEIGSALEEKGGKEVRTECKNSWSQRRNDVLVTDGGNLSCKVIHAVCPNAKTMKGIVLECLKQAEGKGLTSVSFPAIGTGGIGVSAADAARETVKGIEEFASKCSPTSVKLVRVTVFQAQMVPCFQQALDDAVSRSSTITTQAPSVLNMSSNAYQVVEVTFYACNHTDIDNAKRDVSKTIANYMVRECLRDDRLNETIRHMQQNVMDSIIQQAANHHVLMTITGCKIEMYGLEDDVEKAAMNTEKILWEKKNEYDTKRLMEDVVTVPDYWKTHPSGVGGLDKTSSEYKDVEAKFLSSVGKKVKIVSIHRVQNEEAYKAYRTVLKERMKTRGKKDIERILYHGTAKDAVDNINQNGLNRSYCGKNATAYGNGVYFAKDASYSAHDTYSPRDSQGNKHIYQVRVIVGRYTAGNSGIVQPPPINSAKSGALYDSIVDDVNNPTIFVVFRDNEAYPEYLIVFK